MKIVGSTVGTTHNPSKFARQDYVDEKLDGKLDKITNNDSYSKVLYLPPHSDTPTGTALDTRALEGCVVRRKYSPYAGHIELPDLATNPPALPNLAVSKEYVDNSSSAINKRIDKLEGMLITDIIDSSEAYAKRVPTKSVQKAMLNSIGGKTIKKGSRNICTDAVEGGRTVTVRAGGAGSALYMNLSAGTYYIDIQIETISGSSENQTWTYNGGTDWFYNGVNTFTEDVTLMLEIENLMGSEDYVCKVFPTIVQGTEAPEGYEPYEAPSLEATKVTEIVSRGRNLLSFYKYSAAALSHPSNTPTYTNSYGTTITVNEDNSLTVNQSIWDATESYMGDYKNGQFYIIFPTDIEFGKRFTISFDVEITANPNNYSEIAMVMFDSSVAKFHIPATGKGRVGISFTHGQNTTTLLEARGICIRLRGMSMKVSNPMLTNESTDITYSPYIAETYALPEVVVNDVDWGISVGDVVNTYDFDSKEYSKPIKRLVLTGNEIVGTAKDTGASFNHFYVEVSGELKAIGFSNSINLRCSHYNEIEREKLQSLDGTKPYVSAGSNYLRFIDPELLNGDYTDFKAKLKRLYDAGNPVIVDYILATPEIKAITDDSYHDYKFIKVEGDGELIAENENKNPVPWTVTFAEV